MENQELIESTLKEEEIAFEEIPEERTSPLAQPVIDKTAASAAENSSATGPTAATSETAEEKRVPPTDAPEQKTDEEPVENAESNGAQNTDEFTIPLEHAGMMADSIIGTIDNTLFEVGGGYFVTIHKHKDFYDFEELIEVIEEQNVKNIKRLKLDDEDKALLRPLIIQLIRKKAAALTPEKQLLMVAISIIIKKAKAVIEIRSENEMLVERIRDIIRKAVSASKAEVSSPEKGFQAADQTYQADSTQTNAANATELPDEALEILD